MTKDAWHRKWKRALKDLAKILGFAPNTFDVRSNKGGDAILGEVTLHTDTLYIEIANEADIMYRSCVGRKDYVGGTNRWMPASRLVTDTNGALAAFRAAMAASGKESRYPTGSLARERT